MISNETLEEICEKLMTRFANEEEIEAYCERTGRLAYSDDEILIMEGIHCLNDELTYLIPKEQKFKIYISYLFLFYSMKQVKQ